MIEASKDQKDYTDIIIKVNEIINKNLDMFRVKSIIKEPISANITLTNDTKKKVNGCVVLQEDTFVELGASKNLSLSLAMWTNRKDLIKNRYLIAGKDIQELEGTSVSFLQIILLQLKDDFRVKELDITRIKNLSNLIPGFMTKSMFERIWIRIHKDLAAKGFSFDSLGDEIYKAYIQSIPEIEGMDIILVTENEELISEFITMSQPARLIQEDNTRQNWLQDGTVTCEQLDCRSCEEKPICDKIKDVVLRSESV